MQVLDDANYIPYREHTFLSHPSVPRHITWDTETVYLYWPDEAQPPRYAAGTNLVMDGSLTDAKLRQELSALQDTRVLHIENLEPHAFAGFVDAQVRAVVVTGHSLMLYGAGA